MIKISSLILILYLPFSALGQNTLNIKEKIKQGVDFPELRLINTEFNNETLKTPRGEYTFVDFWFSSCCPYLEQLPALKEIYKNYKTKGFNIIGISTAVTKNAQTHWKKRIIENDISWKNYLNENAVPATNEKISQCPTNFLIDKDGKVMRINISLEDLRRFLAIHLPDNPGMFYDRVKF